VSYNYFLTGNTNVKVLNVEFKRRLWGG